ncbi:hypothetical protein [Enterococcus hirae]|uniref:hypothetical protein n=1 Tax=Enterococcus hirae TaxID=1354 RepID=UPI0035D58AAF
MQKWLCPTSFGSLPLNRIKIRMIDLQAIAVLLKTVEMLAGRSFFSFYWHL